MKTKLVLLAALLVVSTGLLMVGCPKPSVDPNGNGGQPPVQGPTVRVAANLPLTGDLAVYGTALRDAANMAVEDMQAQEPGGPQITFDWQDNATDPKQAVTVMQKQFMDPPSLAVVGLKPQAMAVLDQFASNGVPNFAYVFDAVIPGRPSGTFRTLPNYKLEAQMYLDYVKATGAKRVAILYINLPHTDEEFKQLVIPHLSELGVEKTFVESYEITTDDFKTIAAKTKEFSPDLVMLSGFPFTIAQLIRALRPLGVIEDGNTIGTFDTIDVADILGPDEMEGIRVVAPAFVTKPTPASTDFDQRFRTKYGRPPIFLAGYGYDMAQMIHAAAKTLGQGASTTEWIDALKGVNMTGITGPLSFDSDGDITTPLDIGVFREGKLVSAEVEM